MKTILGRIPFMLFAATLCLLGFRSVQAQDTGIRQLAPGVETTIPLAREEAETNAEHDVIELVPGHPGLQWTPQEYPTTKTLYHISQGVLFRRGIWEFQFTFKPLRLIYVDIPQLDGKMKKELIWYMVYRVTNPGQHMTPIEGEPLKFSGGQYTIKRTDVHTEMMASIGAHRFIPTFLLQTHETDKLLMNDSSIQYYDEVIPAARRAIYERERPACNFAEFYDTVQIGNDPIPVSTERQQISRYGVVTWRGIDPRVDYLTIQIMGLTNAYIWVDPEGAFKPGDPPGTGRQFAYKTLQLNFYRPGDEFDAREEEIKLGVAGHPESQWLYRTNPRTYKPTNPIAQPAWTQVAAPE